jgi:hypothetical protein
LLAKVKNTLSFLEVLNIIFLMTRESYLLGVLVGRGGLGVFVGLLGRFVGRGGGLVGRTAVLVDAGGAEVDVGPVWGTRVRGVAVSMK